MNAKSVVLPAMAIALMLITAACSKSGFSSEEKIIKSAKTSDMTITLSSPSGEVKKGDNQLMLTFADASGKPVDVGAASLNIHMAAMGTMAEMNNKATLTTTETPGKYRAQVRVEMKGTWEAQVKYQGTHGTGQTSMTVQAK